MFFSEALLHILPIPFGYQGYNVLQIYTFFRRLLNSLHRMLVAFYIGMC